MIIRNKVLSLAVIVVFLICTCVPVWAEDHTGSLSETPVISAVDLNNGATADKHTAKYDKKGCSFQIEFPSAGTYLIDLKGDGGQSNAWISNREGEQIGSSARLSSERVERTLVIKANKSGIYNLNFETKDTAQTKTDFYVHYVPVRDSVVEFDKMYYGSGAGTTNFKITVPSNGYIDIEIPECMFHNASYNIRILDKNKKPQGYYYKNMDSKCDYIGYVGLTKGTYYISVETKDPVYGLQASFHGVKEKCGSSRATAVNLSRGKSKSGIAAAGTLEKGDWYKFTITKTQKTIFTISGVAGISSDDGVMFELYKKGKTKRINRMRFYRSCPSLTTNMAAYSQTYIKPGTYYIKVIPWTSGGYYNIKWVK